jgi:uncharacterized membrane protein
MKQRNWTDQKVEIIVGKLLQFGVSFAASVVFLGGVLYFFRYAHTSVNYRSFKGEPSELRDFLLIVRGALHLDSRAVIQFGLLLLIATPVARVAFSVVAFAREHDRTYVAVTLVVLAILACNLLGIGRFL